MPDRERKLAMAQKETLRELSAESRNDTLEIMKAMRYAEKDAEVLAGALAKKYSSKLERTAGIADLKSDVGMDEEDQSDKTGDFASDNEESVAPAAEPGEKDKKKDKKKEEKGGKPDFGKDLEEDDDDDDDDAEGEDFDLDDEGEEDEDGVEFGLGDDTPTVNEKEFDLSPNEEVVLELPGNGEIIVRYNPKGDDEEMGELEPVDEAGSSPFGFDSVAPEGDFGGEEEMSEKIAKRYVDQWQKIAEAAGEAVKPNDRNLGDDTAHSGDGRGSASTKPFKMQESANGPVADHGKDGATMRLQRDGGNTLKSDPDLLSLKIPTKNPEFIMQDNINEAMSFSGEYGDLIKQSIESAPQNIPTEGGIDAGDFERPTQMPETTKQRKTIVAEALAGMTEEDRQILAQLLIGNMTKEAEAEETEEPLTEVEAAVSQVAKSLIAKGVARELFAENEDKNIVLQKKASRTCDAYTNTNHEPVDDFTCNDCGARVVLCSSAQEDGYCPACAAVVKEAQKIVEAEVNTADWGDEFCADERGEDPNGDGGFGTAGKKGRAPIDKNARNVELRNAEFEKEAANEADYWKRAFAEERTKAARYAQAVKTAAKMHAAGMLEGANMDQAIDSRARELMEQGLDVHAMKYMEDQVITIAAQRDHERGRMARAASTNHEAPGLMTSIAMRQPAESRQVDIVSELSNVFSRPRPEDWDEDGHKIR